MNEDKQQQTVAAPSFPPKLAAALAKAQRAMGAATKDRTADVRSDKGAYKYAYATLAAVWESIREPLTANGLAVVQQVSTSAEGVSVQTTLAHESGESVSAETRMPVGLKTPQGYGSAITYARRYGLSGLVGVVADEDDDGAEAVGKPATNGRTPQNEAQTLEALKASVAATAKPATKTAAKRNYVDTQEPPPPTDDDFVGVPR